MKVTPLVTGFVMDGKDRENFARQLDARAPSAAPLLAAAARGAKWLEGPIDRYGLAYYLSSRFSGVTTTGIGDAVGTVAAAALHFYAVVYGVRGLDATLRAATKGIVDGKIDAAREFCRERGRDGNEEGRWLDKGDRESEYERIGDAAARSATLLLLVYSLLVSLYSLRLVGGTATASKSNDGDGDKQQGEDTPA